jgi:hypothetical protein
MANCRREREREKGRKGERGKVVEVSNFYVNKNKQPKRESKILTY